MMKMDTNKKQDKLYSCDLCATSYTFLHGLGCHLYMHTVDSIMHVTNMQEETSTTICYTHIQSDVNEKPKVAKVQIQKNTDNTVVIKLSDSVKPFRAVSGKSYTCDVCKTTFGRYMDYYEHIRLHYFEPPYSSISGASLIEADYGPQYSCNDTDKNKKLFKKEPDDCSVMKFDHEAFLSEQSGGIHSSLPLEWVPRVEVSLKPKRQEKLFTCDICGVTIKGGSAFKVHARTHTGEKPFKCEDCGSSFATGGALRGHILIHTGERPYTCLVCGTSFTQQGALKTHTRVHTGEKPYQCDVCFSRFTQRSHLKQHIGIYNGLCIQPGLLRRKRNRNEVISKKVLSPESRPRKKVMPIEKKFTCSTCGATFVQGGSLGRHKRTHTGEKPYMCNICGVGFTQKCHLISHSKNYNGCSRIKF